MNEDDEDRNMGPARGIIIGLVLGAIGWAMLWSATRFVYEWWFQ
jgi:fucose permease